MSQQPVHENVCIGWCMSKTTTKKRCAWVGSGKPFYEHYHDTEWGVPVHEDQKHFEMLILEGAQAGLSWETILKKREGYRRLFHQFDPNRVANMSDNELESVLTDPAIVRNRLKVYSARCNAQVFLDIQRAYGSFDTYVWRFVENKSKVGAYQTHQDIPVKTPISDALSKDLKKRGMRFVGSTIVYAYLQAVGLVQDHTKDCFRYTELIK